MSCKPEVLKTVPLFSLLDDEEIAVLAGQVDIKTYTARQRIYKAGNVGLAYVTVTGKARVTTIDEDHQEVVVDEPGPGEFFGFASMLEQTPHQTNATAIEDSVCLEISRDDIQTLRNAYNHLFSDTGTLAERADEIARRFAGVAPVDDVVAFIRADSSRALCQPKGANGG